MQRAHLVLQDDLPGFACLKIFTDEPGEGKEYVIGLSEIVRSRYLEIYNHQATAN